MIKTPAKKEEVEDPFKGLEEKARQLAIKNDCPFVDNELPLRAK